MSMLKRARQTNGAKNNLDLETAVGTNDLGFLAAERARNLADAEKYMRLDDEKVQEMLKKYIKVVDVTSIRIKVAVRSFQDTWRAWDEKNLGTAQQAIIYRLYAVQLPETIREYFKDHDEEGALRKLESLQEEIVKLIGLQIETLEPLEVPGLPQNANSFPRLDHITTEIATKVADLEQLWLQACQQVTTVEDKFFLDQVALTYLPDMWRMYTPFANADAETRGQAINLIQDQLRLLSNGVQRIIDETRSSSLRDLQAHKSFLEQRLAPKLLALGE